MSITATITDGGLHHNTAINLLEGKVYVLVGKNGAGKSKLLQSIKKLHPGAVLLKGSYEIVQKISTVNKAAAEPDQIRTQNPIHVASIVAGDPILFKIFQYYFKILFEADLSISENNFMVSAFKIDQEADGFKAIFNLLYYLVSDSKKVVLLDEPERFFHPSMKTVFISLVSEIAKNYNKIIVLTSHSNESIRFDLDNIEVWLLSPQIKELNSWLHTLTIAGFAPKDKNQFKDWISYHTEVFFSKVNGLVEGVSDQIVMQAIKSKLALKHNFENISISHVAASNHEAGGKSRLHKFQSFLSNLNPTFVIADKDVIPGDVTKWFAPGAGDSEAVIIQNAKAHHLHILTKGEIEDYYFIDPTFDFCSAIPRAKANKISAAYEQARIISTKSANDVELQFAEIVEIFKTYVTLASADDILKSLAKDYLIDKYARNGPNQPHIDDAITGDDIDIKFKFAGYGKTMKFPQENLDKIKDLEKEINDSLH